MLYNIATIWHKKFTWNLILQLANGRTVKLKSINWMEIYYIAIAMTSRMNWDLMQPALLALKHRVFKIH